MLSPTMRRFALKAHKGDELYDKLVKKVQHTSGNTDIDFHYVLLMISVLGIATPVEAVTQLKDEQICINKIQEFLSTKASKKQAEAIALRYGITDGKFKILEDVGNIMNCTGQNVRLLEANIIRKMRYQKNIKTVLLD